MHYQWKFSAIGLVSLLTIGTTTGVAHAGLQWPWPNLIEQEMIRDDAQRWTPRGQINPAQPITIVITNTTQEPLEYLVDQVHPIAPGQSVTLPNLRANILMNINATRSVGLIYGLKIIGNRITIDLKFAKGLGNTVFQIDQKGRVYLY